MIENQINMDEAIALARRYFTPGAQSPWTWADDGQTIEWRGGPTIVFRQELLSILTRLTPTGWPALGSLLLLLTACRDGWFEPEGARASLIEYTRAFGPITIHTDQQKHFAQKRERIVFGLDFVNRLAPLLRRSIDAKATIAETVFETATKQLHPDEADAALQAMLGGLPDEAFTSVDPAEDPWPAFCRDIDTLCPGLEKISPEQLTLRGKTGLDQIPATAGIEFAPSERVRALLMELRDDRELSGLAGLAGDLMAAVHVPRKLHRRDELSFGGVCDLSNRGPLDRLLVSELAHDDLTLAIRVALNEAMYLRRESPPRNPPQRRAILIDSGIRAWGVPRVFATAAALALAATAEKNCQLFVFRARRDEVIPVDLTTRAGLASHLEALETSPHPGQAIDAFFDAIPQSPETPCDAILVAQEDVLVDPDFVRTCAGRDDLDWHVATVSREGAFRLFHVNRAGRVLVCQAVLSLEKVIPPTEESRPITPLLSAEVNPRLPLILSTRPFPFLLPQTLDPRMAAVSPQHGLIGITKDGRLMHWRREHRGGRQLSDVVPRGRVHGLLFFPSEPAALAVIQSAHAGNVVMLAANLSTGRCGTAVLKTTEPHPLAIALRGDLLLLIFRSAVDAFNARTGDFLAKLTIPPGITWSNGRFFQGNGAFHAIAYDGAKLWLEKVPPASQSVLRVFDYHEIDGPVALLRDGQIEMPIPWRLRPVPPFPSIRRVMGISPDGARIIITSWEGVAPANFLIDLRNNDGWIRVHGDPAEALLAPLIHRATRSGITLRHNFQAIWATPGGELALLSKKDHVLVLGLDSDGQMTLHDRGRLGPMDGKPLRFSPAAGPRGTRYELGVATWKDGSRAYLDSRGILHLKSADPTLGEISLLLSNASMAGWSSDFERFGDDFFFDGVPTSTPAAFYSAIGAFLARAR